MSQFGAAPNDVSSHQIKLLAGITFILRPRRTQYSNQFRFELRALFGARGLRNPAPNSAVIQIVCVCVFYNVNVLYVCIARSVIWSPPDVCALTINVNGAGNIITPKYVFDKRVCMSRSGSKVAIVGLC